MDKKEKIIWDVALEAYGKVISKIDSSEEGELANVWFRSYAKKIGDLFAKEGLGFISVYEENNYDLETPATEIKKKYLKNFKDVPSPEFLGNILSKDKQKELMLNLLSRLDIKNDLDSFSGTRTILDVLDDFADVGVDKFYISEKIVEKVIDSIDADRRQSIRNAASFITRGYPFPSEFLDGEFKDMWFSSGGTDSAFKEILEKNRENSILFSYRTLNENKEVNNSSKTKRVKI